MGIYDEIKRTSGLVEEEKYRENKRTKYEERIKNTRRKVYVF